MISLDEPGDGLVDVIVLWVESNHRNGSYGRRFTLKGIGEVDVKVPRDRKGEFSTQVIPRSKQYEDALREDLCAMFLAGVSTRTLSLMSERLIGRRISPMEVSNASKTLSRAAEAWRERDLSTESIKYMYVDGTLFTTLADTGRCWHAGKGQRGFNETYKIWDKCPATFMEKKDIRIMPLRQSRFLGTDSLMTSHLFFAVIFSKSMRDDPHPCFGLCSYH